MKHMKPLFTLLFSSLIFQAMAQTTPPADSVTVVVHKDPRLDQLVKKQIQINEETTREARKNVKGFRLLVINTNSREEAMSAKTTVYTYFPELNPYLVWQSPFYKLKVGNFKTRKEAEDYRKKMTAYFPKGVFIINDIIEIKLEEPESGNK